MAALDTSQAQGNNAPGKPLVVERGIVGCFGWLGGSHQAVLRREEVLHPTAALRRDGIQRSVPFGPHPSYLISVLGLREQST